MAGERRYRENEISEIFERAAAPPKRRAMANPVGGLTLAELQSIGQEVGVSAQRIAEAAAVVDRRANVVPSRRDLGMPISVGRVVDVDRAPTDREWALIVAELRRTFNAQGRESSEGEFRSWRNGKLQAHIEPTERGYRFRISTHKTDGAPLNRIAIGAWIMGAVAAAPFFLGIAGPDLAGPIALFGSGSAALGYNALRLPRWASERERQMDHMLERVTAVLNTPTHQGAEPSPPAREPDQPE